MKKGFILILMITSFFACDKGVKTLDGNSIAGSAGAPMTPPNSRISQILQTNIWMIEFYISSSDFEGGKQNRGRWFTFKKDGTFESGYWETKTGGGSWYLEEGGKYPIVRVDSFNDAEDAAWEIQGVPSDPYEMSWVGAKDFPNYGDMVKTFNMLTPPTKAQFGDQ